MGQTIKYQIFRYLIYRKHEKTITYNTTFFEPFWVNWNEYTV